MKFKEIIDFIKKEQKYFIDSEEVDIETYLSKLEKYKKEKIYRADWKFIRKRLKSERRLSHIYYCSIINVYISYGG